jgi:predicted membrane-bound spermidine synthase
MLDQPLLLERPFPVQLIFAIVLPVAFGILTGAILHEDETAYLVLSVLGIGGGIFAGYDHDGADQGFVRGVMGGLLFGVSILVAHSLFNGTARAKLPDPHGVLVALTTILGALLGAWGGALRRRHIKRNAEKAA